jgi:hypothetical protein
MEAHITSLTFLSGLALALFIAILIAIYYKSEFQKVKVQFEKRQTKSYEVGLNVAKGNFTHLLGTFGVLTEYQDIILLSTTSANGPLDLLGIRQDSLDFIEIKSFGSTLSSKEKMVKRLVEEKKVNYRIYDVEIPQNTVIHQRIAPTNIENRRPQREHITYELLPIKRSE